MLVGIWTSWLLPAINLPPVFLNLSRVSSKLIMITSSHDGIIGIITLIIPITLTNWTPPLWIWCACCVNKVLLAYDHPGKLLCSKSSIFSLFSLNASRAIMKKSKTIAFRVIKTIQRKVKKWRRLFSWLRGLPLSSRPITLTRADEYKRLNSRANLA